MRHLLICSALLLACAPSSALAQGLAPGKFDPTGPSDHFDSLLHTKLAGPNAMQSFAFDEAAQNIYVVQTVHGDGPKADGDLLVNRINYGGRLLNSMRLDGFGHGVSLGVTRAGNAVSLWIESQSQANDGVGKGTHVARVPYRAGQTIATNNSAVTDVTPPGTAGRSPRPVIDPVTGNLIVRYDVKSGVWGFISVPIADALAHRWATAQNLGAVTNAGEPKPGGGGASTSQGYTLAGNVAYLYFGDSYDHVAKPGNAHIRAATLTPGKTVTGRVGYSYSLKDLAFREPEGITVQVNGGRPRLVFGFAEDPVTSPDETRRLANFSYKQAWIPAPTPAPTPAPAPVPAPVTTPVVAPPAPSAPAKLRLSPRRVTRSQLISHRSLRISAGGLDGLARIRVTARLRGRTATLYRASRRITTGRQELILRVSAAAARSVGRGGRRVTLRISATLAGQVARVTARLPRR